MGIACGDYDRDGDLDYYITDIGDNHLLARDENLRFTQSAENAEVEDEQTTSWGTAFFDYNNDGWLDLFVSNGPIVRDKHELHPNRLFEGTPNGRFREVSGVQRLDDTWNARGMAISDYDNDGKLDLAVANVVLPGEEDGSSRLLLYRNENQSGNWIKIKLQGHQSNRDGCGSMIKVVSNGEDWIQELQSGSSYLSSHSGVIHFGLGEHTVVDSLIVFWPGKQKEIFHDLPVNKTYLVHEGKEIYFRNAQVKKICPGERINVNGKSLSSEGIYSDTLESELSTMREILLTHIRFREDENGCKFFVTASTCYNVFPNPFQEQIFIQQQCGTEPKVTLDLMDYTGKRIYSGLFSDIGLWEDINLNLSSIPSGIYMLSIKNEEKTELKKIIKID